MYGWCSKCNAITIDGTCSQHGESNLIPFINSLDINPLPELEKEVINENLDGKFKLGEGIFLVYNDRLYRRRLVMLDKLLVEVKLLKDGLHVKRLSKENNVIEGMKKENFCNANIDRINKLSKISKKFSEWEIESNGNSIISFSGGKDSLVISHLLKEFNLKNVFIDTTIEFQETYEFVKKLQEEGWDIDTIRGKSNFFILCKDKGYPKYKNRWCCKTQKFEPFKEYLKENFGDEKVSVFSGVRRWESLSRLEQPLEKPHKHIPTQNTVQPILDWFSLDAWCYIWHNKLPVNKVYDYFDRGGCWLCPFGLKYRQFLLQYSHPHLRNALEKIKEGICERCLA